VTVTGGRVVTVPVVCACAPTDTKPEANASASLFKRKALRVFIDFIFYLSECVNSSAELLSADKTHLSVISDLRR